MIQNLLVWSNSLVVSPYLWWCISWDRVCSCDPTILIHCSRSSVFLLHYSTWKCIVFSSEGASMSVCQSNIFKTSNFMCFLMPEDSFFFEVHGSLRSMEISSKSHEQWIKLEILRICFFNSICNLSLKPQSTKSCWYFLHLICSWCCLPTSLRDPGERRWGTWWRWWSHSGVWTRCCQSWSCQILWSSRRQQRLPPGKINSPWWSLDLRKQMWSYQFFTFIILIKM